MCGGGCLCGGGVSVCVGGCLWVGHVRVSARASAGAAGVNLSQVCH